jgi:hypothetical protein
MNAEQAAWNEARMGLKQRERGAATLTLGPDPHPYRRLRREGTELRLAIRDWRVRFVPYGREVRALAIGSGYRNSRLASSAGIDPDVRGMQCDFVARWVP